LTPASRPCTKRHYLSGFADEIIDVEDYLLVPRIIGRAMEVLALITVVAVPIGVRCSG
jgi:hypothetical protein